MISGYSSLFLYIMFGISFIVAMDSGEIVDQGIRSEVASELFLGTVPDLLPEIDLDISLEVLPELSIELWVKIFEFVNFESLKQLNRTCILFSSLATKELKKIKPHYPEIKNLLQINKNNSSIALKDAIEKNLSCDTIFFLVKAWHADMNYADYYGRKALHLAIKVVKDDNNLDIIKILIFLGADIAVRSLYEKATPLHLAASCKNIDVARFLIDRAKEEGRLLYILNVQDVDGDTPLHDVLRLVSVNGRIFVYKLIELLIKAKADLNIRNKRGERPIEQAIRHGEYEAEALLREFGASED